ILVPAGTPTPATMLGSGGGNAPNLPPAPSTPAAPPVGAPPGPGAQVGPFIGVRPSNSGESFLELEGAKRYEEWLYTVNELTRDQSGGQGNQPNPNPQDPRWQKPKPNP
ncbi:MAG: hypothetical protein ABR517_01670, partial [Thermoanaerobaculia bacterium]